MENELLTTDELSARIKYDVRTIRERLNDSVLIEGIHYFRPFGGRKILYIWEAIQKDMRGSSVPISIQKDMNGTSVPIQIKGTCIPMANGRMLHV